MNEIIKSLQEALQFSPENIPLRLHLADTYLQYNYQQEAESEYKTVLSKDAENPRAKLGLAKLYFQQEKYNVAALLLEELTQRDDASAEALLLHCRALVKEGNAAQAVNLYKRVLFLDPSFKDEELDKALRLPDMSEHSVGDSIEDSIRDILEKPSINFSHVGGMDKVKEEIDLKIIQPLKHADLYQLYGKKIGGGILLYGPPGCGKTHLARATAGEVNAQFINIGINDVLDMWIGSSERNLHELFEVARANTPCVLFFDEVDALGANRSDMRHSAGRHLINQFLAELDGVEANNDGLLILAATNAPWHLDPAFRRPGRFDRIIFVQPPDLESRTAILKILLEGKPVDGIDYAAVAKVCPEFSGADLKAVVDIAVEEKLKEAMKTGRPTPLNTKDLKNAAGKHKPSTREWFNAARNYALYANESGLYDDILKYLK